MPSYSVVNPGALVNGQPEDISVVKANLDAIATVVNGLEDSNIVAGAAINYSKLALAGKIVDADIAANAAIQASKISGISSVPPDNSISTVKLQDGAVTYAKMAIKIQSGSTQVSTDGSSNASINFPVAFSGIPVVVVTNGDVSQWNNLMIGLISVTVSGFSMHARKPGAEGGPISDNGFRCNWVAIGT